MRLVDVLLRDTRWSREDQETPYNPGAEFDKAMLETCEPAPRPAHELQLMLATQLGRMTRDEIFALIPIGLGRFEGDDLMPDPEHRSDRHELCTESIDATLRRYQNRLRQTISPPEGWINCPKGTEAIIQPGNRRHPRPSEQEIGVGLYLLQEKSPSPWHWHEADAGFYPACVAPHFQDDREDDPFRWACKRMKIVHGYGVECCGRDYAPDFAEYPYQQMAAQVCNVLPDCLRNTRTYRLDESKHRCMEAVLALCPLPEAAMITLELPVAFTEEALRNPPAPEFFGKLKVMLENGLIVDRFVACVRGQATFLGAPEALAYAMRLTMAIYAGDSTSLVGRGDPPVSGTQRPWWFKEDIDLLAPFDPDRPSSAGGSASGTERLQIPCDDQGRALLLEVAEKSSFAYRDTLEAYRRAGHRLAALEGVGQECAIHCTAEVVKGFGIGNVERAQRILSLACTLAEEAPPPLRAEILQKKFLPFIERQHPFSTIIGALEGDHVSVHLPGLSALMFMVLGEGRMRAEGISAVTIKPAQIQDAMRAFYGVPLLERARLAIPVADETHRGIDTHVRLLPNAASGREHLALPAPDGSTPTPHAMTKPVWTMMDFYEQLTRECGHISRSVAELYFAFCAPKMPNPLRPPEGFLALLKAYKGIPDERVQHTIMVHPFERERVAHENARFHVDRMMALSHLLDAFAMGIVTEEEMLETLRWLTTSADKKTEVECAWEAYENFRMQRGDGEEHSSHFDSADEELDSETRRRIEEEAGFDHSARLIAFKERTAKVLLLQTLVSAGAFEAHELKESMRDSLLFWQRPDVRWYPPIAEIGLELNEDIAALRECLDAGIVDRDQLLEAIQERSETGDRISDLIDIFPVMLHDLKNAQARIQTVLGEIASSRRVLSETDMPTIERKIADLHEELTKQWGNRRFVVPDAANRLLQRVDMQQIVHVAAMHRYGRTLSESPHRDPIPDRMAATSVANENALKILPLFAHQMQRQQLLETSRLRRALPAPVCEGAAPSEGTSLLSADQVWTAVEEHYAMLMRQLPMARRQVREWRKHSRGLLPVGGKVHVDKEFNSAHIQLLQTMLGYSSTSFRLIHAGSSLLLPAAPSIEELQCAIAILVQEGVIHDERPELQIGFPGRLTPDRCGVLGATCLLATQWTTRFTAESFCTTHDHATGARMIAYDAGAPNAGYPFMARMGDEENIEGRTDVLGRRHPGDAQIIQLVGTILIDEQVSGPFASIGKEFTQRLREILRRYGLEKVLEAPWVFTDDEEKYSKDNASNIQHFEQAVKPCQDAYFACAENYHRLAEAMGPEQAPQDGIIFEVRRLLDWAREQVDDNRPTIIDADPKWQDDLRVLLSV